MEDHSRCDVKEEKWLVFATLSVITVCYERTLMMRNQVKTGCDSKGRNFPTTARSDSCCCLNDTDPGKGKGFSATHLTEVSRKTR
jgi:hypothetical protein